MRVSDKASQLYNQFYSECENKSLAKKCALIAIEEILMVCAENREEYWDDVYREIDGYEER